MSLRRDIEVIRAVVRAIAYRRRAGAPWIRSGLELLWVSIKRRVMRRPRTDRRAWRHRGRMCRTCDLYDPTHRTCGHTLAGLPGEVPLYLSIEHPPGTMNLYLNGCSCLVGVKASYPDATCYAVDCGLPSRWTMGISLDGKTRARHPLDRQASTPKQY